MRTIITIIAFIILSTTAYASMQVNVVDNYSTNSSTCTGTTFDCGTNTDQIATIGSTFNATINVDDGLGTYFCLTYLNNGLATTKSCIIRQGFDNNDCDIILTDNLTVNKSEWFNSTSVNLTGYGWNGLHSIPILGTSSPTKRYQINTSHLLDDRYVFIEYICNDTPQSQIQSLNARFVISNNKGVICSDDGYQSVIYNSSGAAIPLSTVQLCSPTNFCDASRITNYTQSQNISRDVCTPGCDDNLRNGNETDVDYGGVVCGNCTATGRSSDEFYVFGKGLQEDATGPLTNVNRFNASLYCEQGTQVGSSVIVTLSLVAIIAIITLLLVFIIIIPPAILAIAALIRFLRRKKKQALPNKSL